jgi:hypothetical protein
VFVTPRTRMVALSFMLLKAGTFLPSKPKGVITTWGPDSGTLGGSGVCGPRSQSVQNP